MTDVKVLSNEQLVDGLRKCIRIEFENSAEMVAFIEEVDRRRLYFDHGYNSLFDFLTRGLGLSNASAQLRIDSARLMKVVPEIRQDLSDGTLHMSQLASIAKAVRQKKKESGVSVSVEMKKNLVDKVRSQSDNREIQKVIAQELDLQIQDRESIRVQKDESMFLEMRLSKEQRAVIEKAKELFAHVDPNPSWAELFAMLAERFVKQKDPARERRVTSRSEVKSTGKSTSGPEVRSEGKSTSGPEVRLEGKSTSGPEVKSNGKAASSVLNLI